MVSLGYSGFLLHASLVSLWLLIVRVSLSLLVSPTQPLTPCQLEFAPATCNPAVNKHLFKKNGLDSYRHSVPAFFLHVFSHHLFLFRYWRYNEEMRTMDPGYPKPITVWKGVPDSPQGAFVDKANGTFCPSPHWFGNNSIVHVPGSIDFSRSLAHIVREVNQNSIDWNLPQLLHWDSVSGTLLYMQYQGK